MTSAKGKRRLTVLAVAERSFAAAHHDVFVP